MRIRRTSLVVILGSLALLATTGCDPKTSDRDLVWVDPTAAMEVGMARRNVLGIGRATRVCWLDPRSVADYEKEHIPNAVNLPFPAISDRAQVDLAGYDEFVVYGTDYADPLPASASKRLMEMGFKKVYTLKGGLRAWKRDGQPVVSGPTPEGTSPAAPAAPATAGTTPPAG